MKKKRIYFRGENVWDEDGRLDSSVIPKELLEIQKDWADKANAYGDKGSCVLGAGFEFSYKGENYKMIPASKWQGSISWEMFSGGVYVRLKKIGATNVRFNVGILD